MGTLLLESWPFLHAYIPQYDFPSHDTGFLGCVHVISSAEILFLLFAFLGSWRRVALTVVATAATTCSGHV